MGGAASNCSCQQEVRTQDLGSSSSIQPKSTKNQFNNNDNSTRKQSQEVEDSNGEQFYHDDNHKEYKQKQIDNNDNHLLPPIAFKDPKIYDYINNPTTTTRKLQSIQDNLKENQVFLDTEFPPTLDSLTKNSQQFHEVKDLEWRRLRSIFGEKTELSLIETSKSQNNYEEQIKNNNDSRITSAQSLLGQNTALSFALSIIGCYPDLVKQLFEFDEYNPNGLYSVWLNFNGEWKEIIIDDQIPCYSKGTPAFIKPYGLTQGVKSSSITLKFDFWSLLLEKAYAKLYSSYDKLDIGLPQQIITDLTGTPYKTALTIDTNLAWKFVISNLEKKFIITASPKYQPQINSQNNTTNNNNANNINGGLIENNKQQMKQYIEIIDYKEVEVNNQIREKIIKVRNPLNISEWKGDWSSSSLKWTEELREQVENTKDESYFINLSEKGITWMPFESFCQMYDYIYSNCIHQGYYFYSRNIILNNNSNNQIQMNKVENDENKNIINKEIQNNNFKDNFIILPIDVQEDNTHVYLQYHQTDKRSFYKVKGNNNDDDNNNPSLKVYQTIDFYLFKGNDQKITEYIFQEYGYNRNGHIENTLNKGKYLAILTIKPENQTNMNSLNNNNNNNKNTITISSYSNKEIQISANLTDAIQIEQSIDQCLMNIPPLMTKDIYKYPEDPEHIQRYNNISLGYYYFVYTNTSQTTSMKETVVLQNRKYINICLPYINSDEFTIDIQPLQKKIVKYQIQEEQSQYGLSQYAQFKHHSIFQFNNQDLYSNIKSDIINRQYPIVDGQIQQSIECYQHLFRGGLALFFINNSNKIYCEDIKVELYNLSNSIEGYKSNDIINIVLQSKKTKLILFNQILPKVKPSFKVTSLKKYFQ